MTSPDSPSPSLPPKDHAKAEPDNGSAPQPTARPDETPLVTFDDLARGHRIVHIAHGQSVYELRLTRNGRLVLYK